MRRERATSVESFLSEPRGWGEWPHVGGTRGGLPPGTLGGRAACRSKTTASLSVRAGERRQLSETGWCRHSQAVRRTRAGLCHTQGAIGPGRRLHERLLIAHQIQIALIV